MYKFTTYYSDKCGTFRKAFKGMDNVTTFETEWVEGREGWGGVPDVIQNQDCSDFNGSAHIDSIEFIAVSGNPAEGYEVYINNTNCEIDENGCAIFTDEDTGIFPKFGRGMWYVTADGWRVAKTNKSECLDGVWVQYGKDNYKRIAKIF